MSAVPSPPPGYVSYEDYCLAEAQAGEKHDYDRGKVVAMAGGSFAHGQIAVNILGEARQRLKGKPCQVIDSNFRTAFPNHTYSHYPDSTFICEKPQIDPSDPTGQSLTNPTAIIEVLSPSTADFDRGTKFDRYRELTSLREYINAFQDRPEVQTFYRGDDGIWLMQTFAGLSNAVVLRSLGITLPLAEIYDRVTFPTASPEAVAAL